MENSSSNSQTHSSKPSDGETATSSSGTSSEKASGSLKSLLDSPEWEAMSREWNAATETWKVEMEIWWKDLTPELQQWAFYNVCRLIYEGDVKQKRSYRGVLYDTFGWGPEAYALGMEARYMEIHNLIGDGLDYQKNLPQWEIDRINKELNDAAQHDSSQN